MRNFPKTAMVLAATSLLAASCGQGDYGGERSAEQAAMYDMAEEPGAVEETAATADDAGQDIVSEPQIAYRYGYSYRLPADRIDEVQRAHVALCDELGTARCRIENMERASGQGDYGSASLTLRVDSGIAREFGDRLDAAASDADGESSGRTIQAEDLSRQIVDTEARIRAKQALADRLLTVIQNRAGTVGELVEAERAFAQAQEELDSARTWLAEMRRRVAMSVVTINYQSYRPESGFWSPVSDALSSSGQLLGMSLAAVIAFVVMILPWALMIIILIWILRRTGGVRHNFRRLFGLGKKHESEEEASANPE
jgi:hypothetical protein